MNVKQFSARVGLTAHAVRYYDSLGLLGSVERNGAGHRIFAEKDIEWMAFVHRLKATGMPLKQILVFAELRQRGEETVPQRKRILEAHAAYLEAQIAEQREHLKRLEEKIDHYRRIAKP